MSKQLVIIGGGASGLIAAIFAARAGASVTVLEQNDRSGKKLLATGNGRCNLTNLDQTLSHYHGAEEAEIRAVLDQFSVQDTLQFFSELGVCPKNRNGWIYPNSDSAASVLQLLLLEAEARKVKMKTRERVTEIRKTEHAFVTQTETWQYESDCVILSCGSPASAIEGASDTAISLGQSLGLQTTPFLPALVPMKGVGSRFSKWAGVRVRGRVSLYTDGTLAGTEEGELQLTDTGISGIPVFQLSGCAVRALENGSSALLELDFLPDYDRNELHRYLAWRKDCCPYKTAQQLLVGLLPEKLIPLMAPAEAELSEIVENIKKYPMILKGAASLKQAQVCSGGILLENLTSGLEAKGVPGFYVAGEATAVSGDCGGYNLQWAWSSGAVAGRHSAGEA